MRRGFAHWMAAGTLVLAAAGSAEAVSIRDLVKLAQAGLGDEVLVALIESDGSVFRLMPEDLLALRADGLSDAVLAAMLRTATRQPPPAAEPAGAPPVQVTQTVTQTVTTARGASRQAPARTQAVVAVPVAVPVYVAVPVRPAAPPEPVYWGYGGQRRPDSWQPGEAKPPVKKDR